jgi:hypothetical protein
VSQSIPFRARLLTVSAALVAAVLSAAPVHAQILYGSIVGTVTDAQGATVPGATVTIVNKDTNLTRDAVTTGDGTYSFTNVLAGPYDVKVALAGFREAVRTSVPVTIGQIARVDVTLQVGTLTETVTVASAAELLQTDKADVSTELNAAAITQMPLNRSATTRRSSTWCRARRRWPSATRKRTRRPARSPPTSTARPTPTTRPGPTAPPT